MKPTLPDNLRSRLSRAYTLMEVLAASAVVGIGMTAAVSLSSTLMIQEELSWRVAVVRNYQENMGRLWQLGVRAEDVMNLMPRHTDSPMLNQVIFGTPVIVQTGVTTTAGLGTMQVAAVTAAVNISLEPAVKRQGAALTFSVYRPKLPTELRPAAP